MDFRFVAWPLLIPIIAIIGGFVTAIFSVMAKARVQEARIRERIAMIERGLVPPPEVDPAGFDRAMNAFEHRDPFRYGRSSGRHRRSGVTLMGIGFGLMVLIGLTSGETSVALGVGGFLVVLGLAFLVNSFVDDGRQSESQWRASVPPQNPPAGPSASASASDRL